MQRFSNPRFSNICIGHRLAMKSTELMPSSQSMYSSFLGKCISCWMVEKKNECVNLPSHTPTIIWGASHHWKVQHGLGQRWLVMRNKYIWIHSVLLYHRYLLDPVCPFLGAQIWWQWTVKNKCIKNQVKNNEHGGLWTHCSAHRILDAEAQSTEP